jgi:hypothetical protein
MSHFTTVNTEIRDIAALRAATDELGLELLENAEARGFASNRIHGDYVIKLRGPYDIALQRQPNGSFGVVADLWQGHVEREVGQGFGRLKQLYGVHKTIAEARKRRLTVRRQNLSNGRIRLQLVKA